MSQLSQQEIQLRNERDDSQPREVSILEVIQAASADPKTDVDKLGKLLEMQERFEAGKAEKAFNVAMATIASKLPRIKKNGRIFYPGKEGKQGMDQPYAKYEDIDAGVRPILQAEGLSVSFTSRPIAGAVILICTISHVLGHSRVSEMQLPPDQSGGKNAIQALGSSRAYAKRYLLCDMLNIVTEGADDDGKATGYITDAQVDQVNDIIADIGMDPASVSKFLGVMCAKTVREIAAPSFGTAMKLLEQKRRVK